MRVRSLATSLLHAIASDITAGQSPGADQRGGVGNNAPQHGQGAPRGGHQEDANAARPDGCSLHPEPVPGQPEADESIGGALPGETDYLDAHDLVDWDQAPFAATAWAIGRPANPDLPSIARWLWFDREGKVDSTLAPDFCVVLHPGRGMTLRRPGLDAPKVERAGVVLP